MVRTYKIDSWSAANEVITRQAYGVFYHSACAKDLHRLGDVSDLTSAPAFPLVRRLFQNIAGPDTFNLFALSLASLVFSLGKLTVYAANSGEFFVYSACAMAISQSLVVIALLFIGKYIFKFQPGRLRALLVLAAILIVNFLGTNLFEFFLRSWNLVPITHTLFQQVLSLIFIAFIYLGFGWVFQVLGGNLKQVDLAKELLSGLARQRIELTQEIRDARTYSVREISLEIQSTLGTLESLSTSDAISQSISNEAISLKAILSEIDIRINAITNRFPGPVRMPKMYSKVRYSASVVISASTKPNTYLPGLIAVVAFFGFCSWLSYFMNSSHAALWGLTLSAVSFIVFFVYEKFAATKLLARPVYVRILVFEFIVCIYLFFWLVVLGYFAGDDSGSYFAALAYAAIPFIFFNGGALLRGVIVSSQDQREQLTKLASSLRKDLAELEQIRSAEDKVWKSLFAGDIALSPTTASVVLRDATLTKDENRIATALKNVMALWNSVLVKISKAT